MLNRIKKSANTYNRAYLAGNKIFSKQWRFVFTHSFVFITPTHTDKQIHSNM